MRDRGIDVVVREAQLRGRQLLWWSWAKRRKASVGCDMLLSAEEEGSNTSAAVTFIVLKIAAPKLDPQYRYCFYEKEYESNSLSRSCAF